MAMKLISFVSFKGGAGKTTALMILASALVEAGKKIALFESDENRPLAAWQSAAQRIGTWNSKLCTIYDADEEDTFISAFEKAEAEGCDYALADTAGGGSELVTMIMSSSQLVVIPTSMTTLDLNAAMETFDFALNLYERNEESIPTKLLLSRVPMTRLTSAERINMELISEVPQFETRLVPRGAFADVAAIGMLHLYEEKLRQSPSKRLLARHIRTAQGEAKIFAGETLKQI